MSDLIDRQVAINALIRKRQPVNNGDGTITITMLADEVIRDVLNELPSVQPEIIYCKDCVKHNKGHGYYLDGTVIGIKDCCPLVEIRGIAQGHEFDYQYCAYAERRTNG